MGGQRAARAPGAAHGDIHLRAPGARCLARASPRSARVRHDRRGAQTSGAEIMQAHCSHPFAVARRHRAHRSCRLTPHVMACLCVGVPLGPSPARPPCPPPCLAWKRRGAPRCTRRPWARRSGMHTIPADTGRPRALACRIGPLFRVLLRWVGAAALCLCTCRRRPAWGLCHLPPSPRAGRPRRRAAAMEWRRGAPHPGPGTPGWAPGAAHAAAEQGHWHFRRVRAPGTRQWLQQHSHRRLQHH